EDKRAEMLEMARVWDRSALGIFRGAVHWPVPDLARKQEQEVERLLARLRSTLISWPAVLEKCVPCVDDDAAHLMIGEFATTQLVCQQFDESRSLVRCDQSNDIFDNVDA